MKNSHQFWQDSWYGKSLWVYCLLPLSWLFCAISQLRKFYLSHFSQHKLAVPVVVVGNISLGGTGKTPLLIALVQYLQQQGHSPGVVSRGYGGRAPHYPYLLDKDTRADQSGDEPLLIFNATHCRVCVAPDRVAAALLLQQQGCTIILSDDGLQHYRLGRDIEIAVVDGLRLFGNRQCLPVGPLREPVSRLKTVDLIVVNNPQSTPALQDYPSVAMQLVPNAWRQLDSQALLPLSQLVFAKKLYAVAAIGNPQRFFNSLRELSLTFETRTFVDHHHFTAADFAFSGDADLVMTEKDAVKCCEFARKNWYSLLVAAELPADFWQGFQQKLDALTRFKKSLNT